MGYSFRLTARVLLYAPSHRQNSTYHGLCYFSCGALTGTRNSTMGPPHEKRSDNPSHHERMNECLTTPQHEKEIGYWVSEKGKCMKCFFLGAGRSSEVERSLMVRWIVGSILHGVDPLSYLSFQPVLHNLCNKGRGMCYPVCGMVHIKEPLLLIDKSSLCGDSGFSLLLSEWSLTICLTPYNHR